MKTFKSPMDIVQLDRTEAVYPTVLQMLKRLMIVSDQNCRCWCPESQGYIIALDETDNLNDLMPVWEGRFKDIPFEHVYFEDGVWVAMVILASDYGLIWLLEDGPWIQTHIRTVLEENADSAHANKGPSYV